MVRLEGFQIDDVKGLGDGRYRRVMGLFFRISIFGKDNSWAWTWCIGIALCGGAGSTWSKFNASFTMSL